jgi:hypothetical protein
MRRSIVMLNVRARVGPVNFAGVPLAVVTLALRSKTPGGVKRGFMPRRRSSSDYRLTEG